MALLDDSMFDPSTFAPTPGMLAQMLAAQGGQAAPPPSMGFPGAQPMSSGDGGAMMPVPGQPAPDLPPPADVASLPPSSPSLPIAGPPAPDTSSDVTGSTPSKGGSSPDIPDSSLLGRLGEFLKKGDKWRQDNRSTLMALGAGMMGAQNIGQGLGRGAQLALHAQQTDIAQQKENQTVKWLVDTKHLPVQEAQALVNNPEILKQVLPQLMGAKQLQHVIIKGTMGEDIPLTFDGATGKWTRADISGGGIASGGGNVVSSIEDVPKEIRGRVQAILEGREAPPPGGSRSPQAQALLNYAGQVEPGFDFTKWTTRNATAKDFASGGKSGMMIKNAEQGLGHVEELMKAVDALPDTGSPLVNRVWNEGKKQVAGNPAYRDVITNSHAVADEFSKMWKGGSNSDAEIRSWEANLDPNMTKAEWHSQVAKLMGLLNGSLSSLETNRTRGMATTQELPPILSGKSKAIMDSVGPWIKGEKTAEAPAAPAAAGSAGNPIRVKTPQEAKSLPKGTHIILPDGSPGVVP